MEINGWTFSHSLTIKECQKQYFTLKYGYLVFQRLTPDGVVFRHIPSVAVRSNSGHVYSAFSVRFNQMSDLYDKLCTHTYNFILSRLSLFPNYVRQVL